MAAVAPESPGFELRKGGGYDMASPRHSTLSSSSSSSSEASMPPLTLQMDRHSSSSSSSEASMPPPTQQMDRHSSSSEASTPHPAQQMDRQSSSSDGAGAGRIPAAVFEQDAADATKDWSMMSTESVFGLQVAPSNDFTGFFLSHPELMDISTPVHSSSGVEPNAAAPAATTAPAPAQPFESIAEASEGNIMAGNYSFAFPNLIEDKRNNSKRAQEEQPSAAVAAAMTAPSAEAAPASPEPEAEAQTSSKPEAAPEQEAAKGGLFSFLPCCS
ncbi:hypothetical protein ACP4OV_030590 [Aristida adscensionis]